MFHICKSIVRDKEYTVIVKKELDKTIWIPLDEANTSYQEYLKWVAQGNVAEEWSAE